LENPKKKPIQRKINSAFNNAGPYLNIGYFFMGGFALFGYIGYKIDKAFQFKSLFLLLGMFLALILGFYNMFKVLAQLKSKTK